MKMIRKVMAKQLLIGEALKSAAHNVPDKEAFVFEDQRLTYQELLKRTLHLSEWLQGRGIGKDEKVGCLFKNGLPFVELYFGVSLAGGVFVPVNFRLVSNEVDYILNHSDVKILFIEEEFIETIRDVVEKLTQIQTIVIVGSPDKDLGKDVISYHSIYDTPTINKSREQLSDDDAHAIIYTSGTTGRPKGAVLTHKNLYMNGMNKLYHSQTKKGSKHLLIPPLFHVAALSLLVQNCLLEGTMFIHREFQPVKVLKTLHLEKINSMFLVPSMWNFLFQVPNLLEYNLSSMTSCSTGGAICPVEIKKKIMTVFKNAKIHEAFGQTEMSPSTTYLSGEDSLRYNKTASVGKPSINVRVRIVDDEMKDVPLGEVGEIVYQGPTMMKEYYKNIEATKEAFKGGWFHSGDLVRMDEDGYIYVVDRKKDMIISGGENIYPKELEEVLYSHPDILEAAVIGVPDVEWGESVKVCIVLKPGKQLTKDQVIKFCQSRIASYKKPRFVQFMDSLPRNASGKVLKTVLRSYGHETNFIN
ncbi:class I adenylate-forming enzyme family protein [Peribacillus frigoritolerans]|uniref:class I adenylate-forming enzyme family protein n=1 Tax=Peribacillus castrilensis TaxID=2897690 RepID=UPI00296EAC10|nr:long-chain-fatty-acid--CoA ligase [Peribacillus castrilensis]